MSTTNTTFGRIAGRVRRGMAEMSYAQRRVFENRTGIPANDHGHVPGVAVSIAELERLYARESQMTWR